MGKLAVESLRSLRENVLETLAATLKMLIQRKDEEEYQQFLKFGTKRLLETVLTKETKKKRCNCWIEDSDAIDQFNRLDTNKSISILVLQTLIYALDRLEWEKLLVEKTAL